MDYGRICGTFYPPFRGRSVRTKEERKHGTDYKFWFSHIMARVIEDVSKGKKKEISAEEPREID
jgi:hypothetical protein